MVIDAGGLRDTVGHTDDASRLGGPLEPISVWPKSSVTAGAVPIVLYETDNKSRRLIFEPEILDRSVSHQPLKGQFKYQHREGSRWSDAQHFQLNRLPQGQEVRIKLDSDSTRILFDGLSALYRIIDQHGFRHEETDFVPMVPGREIGEFIRFLRATDSDRLASIIPLLEANIDSAEVLTFAAGAARLRRFLFDYNYGLEQSLGEPEWQDLFARHSWVLSQAFAHPVVLVKREVYVGGKRLDGTGGNFVDYLFKTPSTNNAVLVEFKTPTADLIRKKERSDEVDSYRNNTLVPGKDLVGGVQQILVQREFFRDQYEQLFRSDDQPAVKKFAPRLVLVVGNTQSLETDSQRHAFELFRRNSRDVEVIAFDELYDRAKTLLKLVESDGA